jgi:hypothetical protein
MFSHAEVSKFDIASRADKYVCSFYISAKHIMKLALYSILTKKQ